MPAFERVRSGIPSLDKVLDNIRLGDNVVIQVTCLNDFKRIVHPFVNQSIEDKRNIIYIRFSNHEPLLEYMDGLKIYQLNANRGFEAFTVEVHNIIDKEGREAFYVFDSLSDLQVAWSTDLMMGNFFCVTCPYLFELDTVALFPVLRGITILQQLPVFRRQHSCLLMCIRTKKIRLYILLKFGTAICLTCICLTG